jgi:uncharacterized protein YbdZ (MbtH family)
MSTSENYGVIVNGRHQFSIWPAARKLPPGWRLLGPTGTRAEMRELLGQQFVETIAAPLITPGKPPRATQSSD